MRASRKKRGTGFTLVEMMIASTISLMIIACVMAVFIQGMKVWEQESIRNELNFDMEKAMENIRADLRLSSIGVGLMAFYPATADQYTAISLPICDSTNTSGLMDRDGDDRIIWNKTVIYHVRPGTPDQLMRTVFSPRYTNATADQLYSQLTNVVAATSDTQFASAALTGESCSSRVIFENLVTLKFSSTNTTFDGFWSSERWYGPVYWGSLVLGASNHTLVLSVTNCNPAACGSNVVIDKLTLSASGSDRDAELFYPSNTHPTTAYFTYSVANGTVTNSYGGPEWCGKSRLTFTPTGPNASLTLNVYNDMWVDNNFNNPGPVSVSNCSSTEDSAFTPTDIAVEMKKGNTWMADSCGEKVASTTIVATTFITNMIYSTTNAPHVNLDGCWARFTFERGSNCSLVITNARVGNLSLADANSSNIYFGGQSGYTIISVDGPTTTNSDWLPLYEIVKGSNYYVRFKTSQSYFDQDVDLFVGESQPGGGGVTFFRNTGTVSSASFAPAVASWVPLGTNGIPYFGELYGDSSPDMVVGWYGATGFKLFKNVGTSKTANMQAQGAMPWSASPCGCSFPSPCLADINGDGKLDFFTGHGTGRVTYMENTGSATNPFWTSQGDLALNSGMGAGNPVQVSEGFSVPEFADIDGDGDLDLFVGGASHYVWYFMNEGSAASHDFVYVTNRYCDLAHDANGVVPRFVDIDGDGVLDMFLGGNDGHVYYYHNGGTATNAVWDSTNKNYAVVSWAHCAPAFCQIDGETNACAVWTNADSVVMSTTNGVGTSNIYGLVSIEVGYPKRAVYRSGIFDTHKNAPYYDKLVWTEYIPTSGGTNGGDVHIRVRSSNLDDMSDLTESSWTDANPASNGYFCVNTDTAGNSLSSLPHMKYVQYEALLTCGGDAVPWANTNARSPALRDVTINWPADRGLVDLNIDFGQDTNCGIVTATVDGQPLVKGLTAEMTIYKSGRTGTNYATGYMEVKPLNTGK